VTLEVDPSEASEEDEARPVLALLAAPGTSGRAVPLLGLLGRGADVVSWHRRGDRRPDAIVATTVAVLAELADPAAARIAVWVKHHDEIDAALAGGADVVLTGRAELVARGAVLVPPVGLEVDRWPAVAPLVRARWRERLGLPEHHVVHLEPGVDPAEGEEALRTASAAVVSGPATLLALALGTPTVTSPDTARRLGVRPGRDVEVAAGREEAGALAEAIAADPARAASLSRRARRCAEHHLDLGRPARVVADRLGLRSAGEVVPSAVAAARLTELATPVGSPTWRRVDDALAALVADGPRSTS
jgi:hypothetical protein